MKSSKSWDSSNKINNLKMEFQSMKDHLYMMLIQSLKNLESMREMYVCFYWVLLEFIISILSILKRDKIQIHKNNSTWIKLMAVKCKNISTLYSETDLTVKISKKISKKFKINVHFNLKLTKKVNH